MYLLKKKNITLKEYVLWIVTQKIVENKKYCVSVFINSLIKY